MIEGLVITAIFLTIYLYLWIALGGRAENRQADIDDLIEESKKLEIPWPEKNEITVTDSMARHVTDRMRAKERYRG